ncbi:hypothetical protein EU546_00655 [Candidatus Thorarchaeota archaeon]|nr:MAG: hypothetical protein EU546_00655 [Candidatus Thorarchaeota archaeon]
MQSLIIPAGKTETGDCPLSMLGPDDFGKSKKERAKKLAKDLAPEVARQIEKILESNDDEEAMRKIERRFGSDITKKLRTARNGREDSTSGGTEQ